MALAIAAGGALLANSPIGFESSGPTPPVDFTKHGLQLRDVFDRWQFVIAQIIIRDPAAVHHQLFHDPLAHTHDRRAVDLTLVRYRIDDRADVVRADYPMNAHRAGVGVDFDFGHLRADIRNIFRIGIILVNRYFQRFVRLGDHAPQRHLLTRVRQQ